MPQARLRRGVTAHTTANLDPAHPVDGAVSRTSTGHVVARLAISEPGERP